MKKGVKSISLYENRVFLTCFFNCFFQYQTSSLTMTSWVENVQFKVQNI